ncbi:hypothetical protein GOP47_0007231 [Adiantum capillus-veneris]|uniref:Uncharacterized protein n=1 Tax=Adiantum capillus-veneris TaxID=13818 RepID=A0A9D4ZKQ3_ADICA|nr:hypothetical protein GOP47_0007231 [Adiantum capillus-veneris]
MQAWRAGAIPQHPVAAAAPAAGGGCLVIKIKQAALASATCPNSCVKRVPLLAPSCMRLITLLLLLLLVLSWRARAWLDLLHHHHHHELKWRGAQPRVYQVQHEGWTFRARRIVSASSSSLPSSSSKKAAKQPGSRPPKCHNECNNSCKGECLAKPVYVSGNHGILQHAIWTCTCVF